MDQQPPQYSPYLEQEEKQPYDTTQKQSSIESFINDDSNNILDVDLDPNVFSKKNKEMTQRMYQKNERKRMLIGIVAAAIVIAIIGITVIVSMRDTNINSNSMLNEDGDGVGDGIGDGDIGNGGLMEDADGGNSGSDGSGVFDAENIDLSVGGNNDANRNNNNIDNDLPPPSTTISGGNDDVNGTPLPNTVTIDSNNAENEDDNINDELLLLLRGNSNIGGGEFNDVDSYQYKAFLWLSQTFDPQQHSTIQRLLQRYALACIFYSTYAVRTAWTDKALVDVQQPDGQDVPGWITRTGWLQDDDECTWYRITCNEDKQVTHIELYSNRLTGSLPIEVTLLKDSLEVLDIYNNHLYNVGPEGNDFLGELQNLKKLFYGGTSFRYDGIPPAIGELSNLVEYDCSFTLYHGSLNGDAFRNLSQLEYLYIGGNSFHSSIPSELAQLPNLQFFYAEYTDLTGDLNFLTQMPSIVELWIDNNPLLQGATIPTEIGTMPSAQTLRSLSLTGCHLSGTIPTSLGLLGGLEQVWLYNNDIQGPIPTELGQLSRLERMGLEDNQLTGTMPLEMCANRDPIGLITKLDSDCGPNQGIECSCCTCCGFQCSGTLD